MMMERQLVWNAIPQENIAILLLITQFRLPMPTVNMTRKMQLTKKDYSYPSTFMSPPSLRKV